MSRKQRKKIFNQLKKTELPGQRLDCFGTPIHWLDYEKQCETGWVIRDGQPVNINIREKK